MSGSKGRESEIPETGSLSTFVSGAITQHLKSTSKVYPQHTNRASELGHPCLRYLTYLRVAYEHREAPDPRLMLIFRDGNTHERAVLQLLTDAGIEIVEQQKPFAWKQYQITGHIDGKVMWETDEGIVLIPLEVKSCHPFFFNGIHSAHDLRTGSMFNQKWGGQMQLYMLMDEIDRLLLVLKNKANGQLRFVEIELDYEWAEELIQKAEVVNKAVDDVDHLLGGRKFEQLDAKSQDAVLPDRIPPDEQVCGRCPFIHLCLGKREWTPKLLIMDDPDLEKMLLERADLDAQRKRYAEVDATAKQVLKNRADIKEGEKILMVGEDWQCRVYWTRGKKPSQRVDIKRLSEEEDDD